jgi:hypothetical protein
VSGSRDRRLWLDAGRATAGVYWVSRDSARSISEGALLTGRARQGLLHLRKHVDGARVVEVERLPGERVVVLRGGSATIAPLWLCPALTILTAALGGVGDGPAARAAGGAGSRVDCPDLMAFEAAVAAARAAAARLRGQRSPRLASSAPRARDRRQRCLFVAPPAALPGRAYAVAPARGHVARR